MDVEKVDSSARSRIDVAKSPSHHLSQTEIAGDNPCSQYLSLGSLSMASWLRARRLQRRCRNRFARLQRWRFAMKKSKLIPGGDPHSLDAIGCRDPSTCRRILFLPGDNGVQRVFFPAWRRIQSLPLCAGHPFHLIFESRRASQPQALSSVLREPDRSRTPRFLNC